MRHLFVAIFSLLSFHMNANTPLISNVYSREIISLNGSWNYIVDPMDNGYYNHRLEPMKNGFFQNRKQKNPSELIEYNFYISTVLRVPGDWNTQYEKLFFYEGSIWFKKDFPYTKKEEKRTFIYFGAVNYRSWVYINGKFAGEHEGGYTPFNFDVTDLLKNGDNFVVVRVNNTRQKDNIPTVNMDWWNYGGITRDVMLVEVSDIHIRDYSIQLPKANPNVITGWIKLNKPVAGETISISIPELKINKQLTTDKDGTGYFEFKSKPQLWIPADPKLYEVIITRGSEVVKDEIGFRTIETKDKKILLNGKEIFLKGISIHEEAPYRNGRAWSKEDAEILLSWAKELGCNYVRLAHYPHNEYMVRTAEKMGLMVWSEIPVYWTISWDNPATYQNAENQLDEMIYRDKNRCAIIIWSIANETPHGEARDKFLSNLSRSARSKDNTRLISMAMDVAKLENNTNIMEDNMNEFVDIMSFNQYLGWYSGTPDDCRTRQWKIPYNKPVIISEFGGGALQGMHGNKTTRWTEEYQEELYTRSVEMFERIDGLAGVSPWVLKDFHSTRRQLPGIQDWFNRKGLISDQGIKKKAFFVMQEWYSKK